MTLYNKMANLSNNLTPNSSIDSETTLTCENLYRNLLDNAFESLEDVIRNNKILPEIDGNIMDNLTKSWKLYTKIVDSRIILPHSSYTIRLLRNTAFVITDTRFKAIDNTIKLRFQTMLQESLKTLSNCLGKSLLNIFSNLASFLCLNPWNYPAFQGLSQSNPEQLTNSALAAIWVTEGWIFLDAKINILGRAKNNNMIFHITRILHFCIQMCAEWYPEENHSYLINNINVQMEKIDPYKAPFIKYVEYVENYMLAYLEVIRNNAFICFDIPNELPPELCTYVIQSSSNPELLLQMNENKLLPRLWNKHKDCIKNPTFCGVLFDTRIHTTEEIPNKSSIHLILFPILRSLNCANNKISNIRMENDNLNRLRTECKKLSNRFQNLAALLSVKEFPSTSFQANLSAFCLDPSEKNFQILFPFPDSDGEIMDDCIPKMETWESMKISKTLHNDLRTVIVRPQWSAFLDCTMRSQFLRFCKSLLKDPDFLIKDIEFEPVEYTCVVEYPGSTFGMNEKNYIIPKIRNEKKLLKNRANSKTSTEHQVENNGIIVRQLRHRSVFERIPIPDEKIIKRRKRTSPTSKASSKSDDSAVTIVVEEKKSLTVKFPLLSHPNVQRTANLVSQNKIPDLLLLETPSHALDEPEVVEMEILNENTGIFETIFITKKNKTLENLKTAKVHPNSEINVKSMTIRFPTAIPVLQFKTENNLRERDDGDENLEPSEDNSNIQSIHPFNDDVYLEEEDDFHDSDIDYKPFNKPRRRRTKGNATAEHQNEDLDEYSDKSYSCSEEVSSESDVESDSWFDFNPAIQPKRLRNTFMKRARKTFIPEIIDLVSD